MGNLPDKKLFPRHIGIIMDGNGRWAKKRGLPRTEGHKQGAKVFRMISDYAYEIGLECVTFYAFSTENWKRPLEEVNTLMDIFNEYLGIAEDEKKENEEKGYYLRFIGDTGAIPDDLSELMKETKSEIDGKQKTIVNIAINYGGQQEILKSTKEIAKRVAIGELSVDDIDVTEFEKGLYTAGLPNPDLIIRPSGEYRLSNFLTWQSAYSELWFSNIAWPDFTTDDLDKAIMDYASRNRRFGGI